MSSHSFFPAVCSAVDKSLEPAEKKRRVAEISLNQTLMDLKISALDEENEASLAFSEKLRAKIDDILTQITSGASIASKKQETKTITHITLIKAEKAKWNEEFSNRRKSYQEAKSRLKDVLKGKVCIEAHRLKSEDLKFLKGLPDFSGINKKIVTYQNRHCIGLIHLEKNSNRVNRSLAEVERRLNDVQRVLAPPFDWT